MNRLRLFFVTALIGATVTSLAGAVPASATASALSGRLRAVAAADTVTCYDQQTILSAANNDYVSAEVGYTGNDYAMLRARSSTAGPLEKFEFCYDATQAYWYIVSDANGLFVSAEYGYTGNNYAMLRARSSAVGPWEKFNLSCVNGPPVSPRIELLAIQSQITGNWVSAEFGYTGNDYGMLRARASSVGPWEQFFNTTICPP